MNFEWLRGTDLEHLPGYLTAAAIGLLIGLERERNPTAKAGLRTCALVALAGAASTSLAQALQAPVIVAVAFAAVAVMMIAAYYHHHEAIHETEPGTTTIAAVVICFLLGAMTQANHARLAVALGISTAVLLYFKAELGGAARRLERRDLVSILQFGVLAFVVFPLLPDRGYGPYGALNPRDVWLMVVLISGVSLAGYVALRIVRGRHGAVLLGLFGGLVSSTATTLAYSRLAQGEARAVPLAGVVVVTANIVLQVRIALLALIVADGVLPALLPALAGGLAGGLASAAFRRRSGPGAGELEMPPVSNPADLRTALSFGALYALLLVASAWLSDAFGSGGIYAMAAASGMVDVDAISVTTLRLFSVGQVTAAQAAIAITVAISANVAFKLGIVFAVGGSELFRQCMPPMAASVAGAALVLALAA